MQGAWAIWDCPSAPETEVWEGVSACGPLPPPCCPACPGLLVPHGFGSPRRGLLLQPEPLQRGRPWPGVQLSGMLRGVRELGAACVAGGGKKLRWETGSRGIHRRKCGSWPEMGFSASQPCTPTGTEAGDGGLQAGPHQLLLLQKDHGPAVK